MRAAVLSIPAAVATRDSRASRLTTTLPSASCGHRCDDGRHRAHRVVGGDPY